MINPNHGPGHPEHRSKATIAIDELNPISDANGNVTIHPTHPLILPLNRRDIVLLSSNESKTDLGYAEVLEKGLDFLKLKILD